MPGKSPRLTLRIACYTAAALLFAAGALLWFVDQRATAQAEGRAAARAHFVADLLLPDRLTRADFERPVTGRRRSRLNTLFLRVVQTQPIKRVSLIAPNGQITYSTDHRLIGELPHARDNVAGASAGREIRAVETTEIDGRRVKVFETYLPVQSKGTNAAPLGVFELSQDYKKGVSDRARSTVLPVGGFLLLALIVLCATLVPILRRVTAAVEERNRRLVQQAATLERSLAAAHEARTEAEAARRALVEQNKRLRELDRLKDEFLSLVSHELRTPLTSIRGYLDLVLDEEAGELNPEQRRFLQAVERNSGRLLRLVGDLLFVAQADAGRLSLEQGKVDLAALAAECVEGAAPAAVEKSIELVLVAKPVPAFVGDRGRLAQVLDNLVSNALKFTPEGGRVEVSTKLNGEHVSVEVSDTGIGIPVADQPRLFERFFRSSVAADQAIPGTGLGLAIVKAIVEAHNGEIRIDSKEGRGTTFRVDLPLTAETENVEEAA
ncbi:MAG TPA: ATP-binding protein [Gaiellaceae bacterium]|nr:ATP-binding protein [Gaiellaceae bacterium]